MRLDYRRVSPAAMRAMLGLEHHLHGTSLEKGLVKLVELRASYINGCAYCVDMHSKDARALGETEQRLLAIPVWRETPFFSERERAALEWTERVTLLHEGGVPREAFDAVREQFSDAELVDLTMAIVTINGWNRLAVSFGAEPGSYQPKAAAGAVLQSA